MKAHMAQASLKEAMKKKLGEKGTETKPKTGFTPLGSKTKSEPVSAPPASGPSTPKAEKPKSAPKPAKELTPEQAEAVKEPPKDVINPPPKKEAPTAPAWVLYVNCMPTKGAPFTIEASDIISTVLTRIAKDYEGNHYRLIPDTYGGGPAIFSEYMRKYLKENPPAGAVILHTTGVEAQDSLEAFCEIAPKVVRAIR